MHQRNKQIHKQCLVAFFFLSLYLFVLQLGHYKCDWHRYNLHLRLKGLPFVTEEEFEEAAGSDVTDKVYVFSHCILLSEVVYFGGEKWKKVCCQAGCCCCCNISRQLKTSCSQCYEYFEIQASSKIRNKLQSCHAANKLRDMVLVPVFFLVPVFLLSRQHTREGCGQHHDWLTFFPSVSQVVEPASGWQGCI